MGGSIMKQRSIRKPGTRSGQYAYVFFDWDGCLADTLGIWMELYKASLSKRGIRADEQAIVRELFNDWSGPERFGVADVEAFGQEIIRELEQRVAQVRLNPHARWTLERLQGLNKKSAVLTGSKRSFVKPVLAREGIEALVDLIVALEDVTYHKPHSEAVEKALQLLDRATAPGESGSRQGRAIMVGDSTKDIEMGKNASIDTVLYFPEANRRFYDPEWLLSCQPHFVIRDFRELIDILG
jgi:phosphoglycolate phosphatase-like HAD superfamily hydrolase